LHLKLENTLGNIVNNLSNTHLYAEEFDQDRDQMIQRAIDAGVTRFFIPAIDSTCTQSMYDLENVSRKCLSNDVGLHPRI
jgi:TatD DNase family protein